MAVAVIVLLVGLLGLVGVLGHRRRRRRGDPDAVERAVRAAAERAAVQERATQIHPDFVRDWMRRR